MFQVLHGMDLTKSESLERVEKIFPKLHWPGFPGVQSLLLKVRLEVELPMIVHL